MSDVIKELKAEVDKYRQEIKSDRMDMSFGEIINMFRDGEMIITPEYQRAFRWDQKHQSDFIESIIMGIPFPSIFVATNDDGKWELIDGLQRVSTVLSFFGELKDADNNDLPKNNLVLTKGSLIKQLEGLDINTVPLEYKLLIKRTPCRVEIIQKDSEFRMRYELFKRLNTGGESLSRQEIRNCIFRGLNNSFNSLVQELSKNTKFREIVSVSNDAIEKMYYEELVLRFIALFNGGTRYKQDTIQDYMDDYMENRCKKPNPELLERDKQTFNKIIDFLYDLENVLEFDVFKLSKFYFTTSMYDSIMLSLASQIEKVNQLDKEDIKNRINVLRVDETFNKYVGSASSNPASITNKVDVAKKILFEIVE